MKNPKFKMGEVVRVLDRFGLSILAGHMGEVVELGPRLRVYRVSFGSEEWERWWIKERDLELVSSGESK